MATWFWTDREHRMACGNLVIDLDNKDVKSGSNDFKRIAESLGPNTV